MAPRRGNRKLRKWCWFCGRQLTKATATKDHKIPQSRGGRGGANKVDACIKCNGRKADLSVEQFRLVSFGNPEGIFHGERQEQVNGREIERHDALV